MTNAGVELPRTRRAWRAVTATGHRRAILALVLAGTVSVIPGAVQAENAAERAAREIQEARDRANAAAQAMFDAASELDQLDVQIADTEAQIAQLESDLGGLRQSLSDMAVRRFTGGGVTTNPLFTPVSNVNDAATANVLAGAASGAVLTDTDEYEATLEQLADARTDLDQQRADAEQARQQFELLKAAAEAEVVRLQEIEQQRLADEAVQRELERQRQERVAAEQAAAEAAAQEAAQQAADNQQQPAQQPLAGGQTQQQPGSSEQPSQPAQPAAPAPAQTPAPAPAPTPAPPPSPSAGSGMVCPVAGSTAFADTWGAPRSGGRSHQGVDMLGGRGTPLVAVESGTVQFKQTNLGGNSVWLNGNSGTRYFYAHLDSFEGSSRSVSQGEVIGYMGDTGNARGTVHLHFEVHPNGPAVNPYPYVRAVC